MKLRAYLAASLTLLLVGLWCLVPARSQNIMLTSAGTGGFTAACSQSSAFLARTPQAPGRRQCVEISLRNSM
jgi:hypothetical protein